MVKHCHSSSYLGLNIDILVVINNFQYNKVCIYSYITTKVVSEHNTKVNSKLEIYRQILLRH